LAYIIYFLIAILSTTIGAMTGMGGGVIIKPVLDMLNDFPVETVSVLSSVTVFSMALVSIGKQIYSKTKISFTICLPLAIGSVAGGYIGQVILAAIIEYFRLNKTILVIQNILLAVLILGVFIYMKMKHKIKSLSLRGIIPSIIVGIFLGICSSFLGIGGGPINVCLIIFVFSFDTKSAAVSSIITILFAQVAKLSTIILTTGFGSFDLSMLPAMIVGAVGGGYWGSVLNRRFSEKTVEKCFNIVQFAVFILACRNIAVNL
jgi:uncharacterized protein